MATLLIGPTGRYPDIARGEWQYAHALGAQTAVLVSAGGGTVHTVSVGVAGTLLKFYDVKEGGTLDATTEIATVVLANADRETVILDVDFSQGLTAVITGDASTDLVISFRGTLTVNPLTFGTQLDGNAGRASGTSADTTVPDR